ncbi:MAG: hypothetical protein P4M12_08320 [Gammaproteobacteria bacterium]|nr:hypothetical protein [Gammaproteobacteria bacterium]
MGKNRKKKLSNSTLIAKQKRKRNKAKDSSWKSTRSEKPIRVKTKTNTDPLKIRKSILAMRTNNTLKITKNGVEQDLKTAALIASNDLTLKNATPNRAEKVKRKFEEAAANADTNRPIESVEYSASGSPVAVVTPGKTVLKRYKKVGLNFYSNLSPAPSPSKNIIIEEFFFNTENYKSVKKPSEKIKANAITITPETLKKAKKEFEAQGKKRHISQNRVMAKTGEKETVKNAGATKYAKATKVFDENTKWEWLHLIAHSLLVKNAQAEVNLAAGTAFANTDMMLAEDLIGPMAKAFPNGIRISCKAHLITNTQIANKIEYAIETDDFILNFVFNPHTKNKAHIVHHEYLKILSDVLLDKKTLEPEINITGRKLLGLFNEVKNVAAPSSSAAEEKKGDSGDDILTQLSANKRKRI